MHFEVSQTQTYYYCIFCVFVLFIFNYNEIKFSNSREVGLQEILSKIKNVNAQKGNGIIVKKNK